MRDYCAFSMAHWGGRRAPRKLGVRQEAMPQRGRPIRAHWGRLEAMFQLLTTQSLARLLQRTTGAAH
jgi:hypothetical protein